jgi:two-component system, NtrC family, sensor histidine kinase KinB
MKIKAKLVLGIGVLFSMIVLLTGMSGLFIYRLSRDTKNILVANYNTLDYSRKMLIALNNGISGKEQTTLFETNLAKQQNNITEIGEKELTEKLTSDFERLKALSYDSAIVRSIRQDITDIMLLNMQAIQTKSNIAEATADNSIFWVSLVGAGCFIIAFILLVNLPGNIANPIKELTKSIQEIAQQNYSERVYFEERDEFGELATSFNTMAQKLEEYQASNLDKLMIEKKRIETLINNMRDPVIGLDDKKRILFMNSEALKITSLQLKDVMGKRIQDIAVQNDLVRSLIVDLFVISSDATKKKEPLKIYADNKESYFEKELIPINIIPTGEKQEISIGIVILLQNITPYKELDFAKTNFIATVSHELKTPISSIKMSLQLLENKQIGNLNEEQENLVDSIKDDAGRLLKITGELLNMTQVESGSIQLSVVPCNSKEIVEWALQANKIAAEQKNVKLQFEADIFLSNVLADSEKTSWVLTNLISNAIRYSHENSTVFIGIKKEHEKIKFRVTDNGQGIAPQYINKIFDRYFRIPGTKKEGTGLGLNISKEFIEAQGGTIEVKSELGAGSTFTVSLKSFD